MKPRHINTDILAYCSQSNRAKQLLFCQSVHASVNMKIRNFLRSFSLVFIALSWLCNILGVSKKQFKCSSCTIVIKIENSPWNCVTNTSATYWNLYELCFSACNYRFVRKIDILHEEQKREDLKFHHRISKKNSFSRYLENIKSRNVLI